MKSTQEQKIVPIHLDQILLFGDSLTQWSFNPEIEGWGAFLYNQYVRKLDVVNRGYSGYNTEWATHILPSVLRSVLPESGAKIRLVTVFLGANDAALPVWPQQHVSLLQYKANLREIISSIRAFSGDIAILLITPPPISEHKWEERCMSQGRVMNRSVSHTKQYRDGSLEVAREAGVPVVDTWAAFFGDADHYDQQKADELLADGVHLTKEGNRVVGKALLEKIKEEWPELNPDSLKPKLPLWDQVDITDLPASLFR